MTRPAWPTPDNPIWLPPSLYEAAREQGIDLTNYAPVPMLTTGQNDAIAATTPSARQNSVTEPVGTPDENADKDAG